MRYIYDNIGQYFAFMLVIILFFFFYRLNRVSQDSNSEVENLDSNKNGNIHKTAVIINPTPPADTNALPKT